MGHHALGVDPRQALTGSRKSAGQSHLYVTRSKERLPTALAGLFFSPSLFIPTHHEKGPPVRVGPYERNVIFPDGLETADDHLAIGLSFQATVEL